MDPVPGKQEMHPCQMSGQQEQRYSKTHSSNNNGFCTIFFNVWC